MKFILSILILFILTQNTYAQQPSWLNPTPFGNEINDVEFFDQWRGLMAGKMGAIAYTPDGGDTWTEINSGTFHDLKQISRTGMLSAIIMADTFLIRSIDGGQSWQTLIQLTSDLRFTKLSMMNAQQGWAICQDKNAPAIYKLLRTGNGWTNHEILDIAISPVVDIAFFDNSNGVLINNEKIYTTQNGGNSYTLTEDFTDDLTLNALAFAGNQTFYTGGYYQAAGQGEGKISRILKSIDGGHNWTDAGLPAEMGSCCSILRIKSMLENRIVAGAVEDSACGSGNKWPVFISTDGGINWTLGKISPSNLNTYGHIKNLGVISLSLSGRIWVYENNNYLSKAYSDDYENFVFQDELVSIELRDMFFGDANSYAILGNNEDYIAKSIDGGITWDTVSQNISVSGLQKIAFAGPDFGLACGIHSSLIISPLLGQWTKFEHPNPSFDKLEALNYPYNTKAYRLISGLHPSSQTRIKKLQYSGNNGRNWYDAVLPDDHINQMQFININTGYLFGGDSTTVSGGYYRTESGGMNWIFHALEHPELLDGQMLNDSVGFILIKNIPREVHRLKRKAAGDELHLVYTAEENEHITDIGFTDEHSGYLLITHADSSFILQTLNAGQSWVKFGPYPLIQGIKALYELNGFAWGKNNQLLSLGNGFPVGSTTSFQNREALIAYPNPVTDKVYIELSEKNTYHSFDLKIRNTSGQVVFEKTFSQINNNIKLQINVNYLPAGLYFIHLFNGKKSKFGKFIKI